MKMETFVINLPKVEEAKQIAVNNEKERDSKLKEEYNYYYSTACQFIRKTLIPTIESVVRNYGVTNTRAFFHTESIAYLCSNNKRRGWRVAINDFVKQFNDQQEYKIEVYYSTEKYIFNFYIGLKD